MSRRQTLSRLHHEVKIGFARGRVFESAPRRDSLAKGDKRHASDRGAGTAASLASTRKGMLDLPSRRARWVPRALDQIDSRRA